MTERHQCPSCGTELPGESPGGFCVPCTLRKAIETDPKSSDTPAAGATVLLAGIGEFSARIGRYKLLQQIGEGGCGIVYLAEQEEPVHRQVALKLIKPGMDSRQVLARFEAERQALALMNHPNIAKVFDAGATQTGRPYFVMELVKGIPITEYCDRAKLSTQERLDLFIQVCQAIQHAHQKGIIHRDIKPANILVAMLDGVAVPKVIDFGIAKATTGQPLTDKTIFTAFEQFIGTPAYMSPEQAELSGLDIDTRSDIYSLGVLLYELLTGKTPFDAKELVLAGLDRMRKIIREDEPPRPSTRVSTLAAEEQTAIAQRRQCEPLKLSSTICGDLDWIVMKALEKERTRRYETVNGLVADLKRHLGNEPVTARPPSTTYRIQKAIRRNKLAFAAGMAVFVMLVLLVTISTWQAVLATRAKQIANQEREKATAEAQRAERTAESERISRQKAEQAAKRSRDTLRFIQQMIGSAVERTRDIRVDEMMTNAVPLAYQTLKDQPEVKAEVLYSIGDCFYRFGMWNEAREQLQNALKLQQQIYGETNESTLATAYELASVSLSLGNVEEAKRLSQWVIDTASHAASARSRESEFYQLEMVASRKLAEIFLQTGETASAEPLAQKLADAARANHLTANNTYYVWDLLARLQLAKGDARAAFNMIERAQPIRSREKNLMECIRGQISLASKDFAKAESLLTNSLPMLRSNYGEAHFRVQSAYLSLVELYDATGRTEEALPYRLRIKPPVAH